MSEDIQLNRSIPTQFKLNFSKMPSVLDLEMQKNFEIQLIDTSIPSFDMTPIEIPWQGGHHFIDGGEFSFGDWSASFFVDLNFFNWKVLFWWMTWLKDNKKQYGFNDSRYKANAILHLLDDYEKEIMSLVFEAIWPIGLSEIPLSYQEDENIKCDVRFSYDRFYINS